MNDETELKALVEEAYSLFSSYPMGTNIAVCHEFICCLASDDAEILKTRPIQDVDRRLIYEYLDAGEGEDPIALAIQTKHLLPKILELFVQGEHIRHSNECIFGKCRFHLDVWKPDEIEFMQRFALCYFQKQLMIFKEIDSVDQFIIMFHTAGLNIQPLLVYWESVLDQAMPMLNLIQMLHYDFEDNHYDQAFADDKLIQIMNQWLRNLRTNKILINALVDVVSKNNIPAKYAYMYDSAFDQLKILN